MPRLRVGVENDAPVLLHYQVLGEGRPVVLVPDWPMTARSWERQVAPLVEAGYRVVVYDRRGFGRSSQPWRGYDLDTLTADLEHLLAHLDLTGAALVGLGTGGGEVVRHLGRGPAGHVDRAVLACATTPYPRRGYDNPDGHLDDAAITGLETAIRTDRLAFLDRHLTTAFRAGDRTDLVSAAELDHHRALAGCASPKGTADCVDTFAHTDLRTDLAAVTVPTLVLHGDADLVAPLAGTGLRTHEALPGSELRVLRGAPHAANLTHPDQFTRALLDFLAR